MILTILFLIPFCAYAQPNMGLFAAFLSGLTLDLWFAKPLGQNAAIFVLIAFLINWYKNKFNATNILFIISYTMIISSIFAIYVLKYEAAIFFLQKLPVYALLEVPIVLVYRFLWSKKSD